MKNIITHITINILTVIFFIVFTNKLAQAQITFNPISYKSISKQSSYFVSTNIKYITKNPIKLNDNQLLKQRVDKGKLEAITDYDFSLPWIEESFTASQTEESNKINTREFRYAGSQRFTINGELPNSRNEINLPNAVVTAGVTLTLAAYLHINQSAAWWDGKDRSLYFKNDWNTALQADKFCHISHYCQ